MSVFFILTCARSGSTSLTRILDTATNGTCVVEPMPNLNVETRLAMDGRLAGPEAGPEAGPGAGPDAVVREQVVPRVRAALKKHAVYGEKNLTYGPFVGALHEQLDARFVFVKRDGRDVVRSMLDWHDRMFGDIYRECRDPGTLSHDALVAAARLPAWRDTSDYSRPRPGPGSPWFERWETMSRLEMCAFCWATVNDLYRDALERLPRAAWIEIDYTSPTPADTLRVAEFCGLEGLTHDGVAEMLASRINSLHERIGEADVHPRWPDWDDATRASFDAIAGATMTRLGYAAAGDDDDASAPSATSAPKTPEPAHG